jgi:hypothetical protein
MNYRYSAGVMIAAMMFILGTSMGGVIFYRLGLFLLGGACLVLLLDMLDVLIAGDREPVE